MLKIVFGFRVFVGDFFGVEGLGFYAWEIYL